MVKNDAQYNQYPVQISIVEGLLGVTQVPHLHNKFDYNSITRF
jgi:hypothetical protein